MPCPVTLKQSCSQEWITRYLLSPQGYRGAGVRGCAAPGRAAVLPSPPHRELKAVLAPHSTSASLSAAQLEGGIHTSAGKAGFKATRQAS